MIFKIFHIFFFEVPSLAELQPDTVMNIINGNGQKMSK